MKLHINTKRVTGKRSPMLYGQFIEHFHRQIYPFFSQKTSSDIVGRG